MALGFIRKIFSFGKNQVEEIAAEPHDETVAAGPQHVEAETGPPPSGPSSPAPALPQPPTAEDSPSLGQPADHGAGRPVSTPTAPEPVDLPPPADRGSTDPTSPSSSTAPASVESVASNVSAHQTEGGVEEPERRPAEGMESDLSLDHTGEPDLPLAPSPPADEIKPSLGQPSSMPADPASGEAAPEITPLPPPTEASAAARVTVSRSVQPSQPTPEPSPAQQPQGWFQRLRSGLSRSSRELSESITGALTKRRLTDEVLQDLEDVLLRADLGMETALRITDALSAGRYGRDITEADVRAAMAAEIERTLDPVALPLELDLARKPHVILVVGVNGTGKTTTIGKLAAKLTAGGLSVMLAAGDTFRAAAIEQLRIWAERTGSPIVASRLGADAAGLAYEAFEKARASGADVLIIDTAGRLQNRSELMAELEKIVRVLGKLDPLAPHTVLQTVDATTGQNALGQVEIFKNVAGVNGLVMTKLDGTARGGILVAIAAKHALPVYFIGVGEQVEDLEPFSARDFAKAIAGVP